jgi:hypothetical protein
MQALRWPPQDQNKTASPDKQPIASPLTSVSSAVNELTAGGDEKSMDGDWTMKKIFLSAAVAMLFASPALAQSYSHDFGTGNVIDLPALEHGGFAADSGPYAYEPAPAGTHAQPEFRGRHVRQQMRRDWNNG